MRLTPSAIDAAIRDASAVFGVQWVAVFNEDDEVLASAGPESRDVSPGMPAEEPVSRAKSMLESVPEPAGMIWRDEERPDRREVYFERIGGLWVLGVAFDPRLTSIGAIRLKTGPARDRIVSLLLTE